MIDLVYERQWSSLNNLVVALSDMDSMGRLYGGFPRYRYTQAGIPTSLVRSFPIASLWNFAARRMKFPPQVFLDEPKWIGNWAARHKDLSPVVIANGTAHRYLFPKIKDTGRKLILERGSTHPLDLFLQPQVARKEAGYPYTFDIPAEVSDEIEKNNLADYILAGSSAIKESYVSHGYSAEKILVASYGIDTERFSPTERSICHQRPLRIGIVGIISFRKGLLRALRIGEWARRRGIPLELHFAGPVFDPECEQMIQNSDATCVLHGVLKGESLIRFYHNCDACCLPSYEEGFGIAVLEGMGTGLPAIVSREAGCSEAVEPGVNGVVLDRFTDDEFDASLAPVFCEPAALLAFGILARERVVKDYTTSASISRIQSAIKQAIT